MDPISVAHAYFDGWNRHDPDAVLATMATEGTYTDPTTGGPLTGEAFAAYMKRLFSTLPDVAFEIASVGLASPGFVAAEWVMRGTNTGSMMGLPPTGKRVELKGADFIRVTGDRIRSVDGYFDSGDMPRQLGLQVIVQPAAAGPFQFGVSARLSTTSSAKPGAFSITAIEPRDLADENRIREFSRQVAAELPSLKGFIGWVGVTIANRMMTISAWENARDPEQLMDRSTHPEAVNRFFADGGLGVSAVTSVYSADRVNTMWVRCSSCQKMMDHAARQGTCQCGAALRAPMAYW